VLDRIAAPPSRVDIPVTLTLGVTATAETTIVTARGEIDLAVVGRLRTRLAEETGLAPRALVLDLSGVTFCSARGITELLVAASEAHVSGVPFAIVAAQRAVVRPISVLRLEQTLPIHRSVADALAWLAVLPRLQS
jgi:anti-sigma B factor antagonist